MGPADGDKRVWGGVMKCSKIDVVLAAELYGHTNITAHFKWLNGMGCESWARGIPDNNVCGDSDHHYPPRSQPVFMKGHRQPVGQASHRWNKCHR